VGPAHALPSQGTSMGHIQINAAPLSGRCQEPRKKDAFWGDPPGPPHQRRGDGGSRSRTELALKNIGRSFWTIYTPYGHPGPCLGGSLRGGRLEDADQIQGRAQTGTESRGARADTTGWRATVGQGGKPPRLMDTFASYMYTC